MDAPDPTEPPWLSEQQLTAWVRLAAVMQLLPAALDSHMRSTAQITHFDYFVLAMLSEAPDHTLRMTDLASRATATLPRLSHVVRRLEERGLVERFPCPTDGRATLARLSDDGWATVRATAPEHVAHVRELVIDALSPDQVDQLAQITAAVLRRLDPDGVATPPSAHL